VLLAKKTEINGKKEPKSFVEGGLLTKTKKGKRMKKMNFALIGLFLCSASLTLAVKITNNTQNKMYIRTLNKKNVMIEPSFSKNVLLPVYNLKHSLFVLLEKMGTNCSYFSPLSFPLATEIEIQENIPFFDPDGHKCSTGHLAARGKWFGIWGKWKHFVDSCNGSYSPKDLECPLDTPPKVEGERYGETVIYIPKGF